MGPMRDRQGENRQPKDVDCSKFLADALKAYKRIMRGAPYIPYQLPPEILLNCRPTSERQQQPEGNEEQQPHQGEPNQPLPEAERNAGPSSGGGPAPRRTRKARKGRMPRL